MESKREERATNVELPPHHPRRGEDLTISGKQPWQVLQEPCARYDLRPSAEFVNQDGCEFDVLWSDGLGVEKVVRPAAGWRFLNESE